MSAGGPRLFDLSLKLSSATVRYPGDPPPELARVSDIELGDSLTASQFSMNCHVGTHVDSPAHFLADGKLLGELPLESFYGPAVVLQLAGEKRRIDLADLQAESIPTGHHVLLKTRNSQLLGSGDFTPDYSYLSEEAAQFLCSRNPLSLGFDYYSLDPSDRVDFPAHKAVAKQGLPVFVCLDLSAVSPGRYVFSGLPLPFEGMEASPVRAVLMAPGKRN